ncbi:MAG: hypothetical protein WDW38_005026 [Sanguina aurantia]
MSTNQDKRFAGFPDYRGSVALKYVKRGFFQLCSHAFTITLVPLAGFLVLELARLHNQGELARLLAVAQKTDLTFNLVTVIGCTCCLVVAVLSYWLLQVRPVYLLDFQVYQPPESWAVSDSRFMAGTRGCKKFKEESLIFQEKILARSGLGQHTCLPPAVSCLPPCPSMSAAREEFENVMFTTVEQLLQKTGIRPKDIGILVVNCSLFNPTPSLCAMIINHFKMRSNVISYNLAGMGCSASPIAIDLARQMLQLNPSTYALVLSTENITQNWYFGNERSFLMPNCLFRAGGAAILLTNRKRELWRSKYELRHVVRTHIGSNDEAFKCIYQTEDPDGVVGVRLSKELMAVAGEALKVNITTLGPLVLPISEQLLFFINLLRRKLKGRKRVKPYIPDFKLAFDHVCIHTGGRAVIDEIERQLALTPDMVEPSRATLFQFGNTSSSSVWYILAHLESQRDVKRGGPRLAARLRDKHPAWDSYSRDDMAAHLASLPNHHHHPAGAK